MFFVLFVLHNPDLLEDLLTAWEEIGVRGVTILPSTGLGRIRQGGAWDDLPIMPSLSDFYNKVESELSRTIFTIIEHEELIGKIVSATESIIGNLEGPETGMMVVLPTYRVFGLSNIPGKEE